MSMIVPSSPADIKAIRDAVQESVDAKIRIDSEKDLLKDIRNNVKDKYKISPKHFNKIVNIAYRQNFSEVAASHDELETLYESVMTVKSAE